MALQTASGPMPVMRGITPSRARAAIAPATVCGLLVRLQVRSEGCRRAGWAGAAGQGGAGRGGS